MKYKKNFWNDYGWYILVSVSILIIFVLWLTNDNKKGTVTKLSNIIIPKKVMKNINNSKNLYNLLSNQYVQPNQPNPISQQSNYSKDSKGEIECRRVVESIFKKPFIKVRPDFLRNVNGQNLELDIFNQELRIAVEYNGRQHYEYIPFFHRTRDSFNNQKQRDFIKRLLCEKNNITLIEVPYTVKLENIEDYITSELENKIDI